MQEGDQGDAVGGADDEVVDRQRERGVFSEYHQLAGDPGFLGVGDQHVAAFGGLHRGGGGEDGFEVAEFVDQKGRGFRADAGHAGDVVDAVAHQGLDFDELVGGDAEFLEHLGLADGAHLERVHHVHARADELHQVFVGRDDGGAAADFDDGAGVGGDEVVGFPVGQFDGGDAEGFGGLADQGELRAEFFRRLGALGLVFVVEAVAEGEAPGIEDHGEMGADVFLDHACQQVGEAEDGVDGRSVRPGHWRKGVEGAEDEARSVDEDQVRRGRLRFSDHRRGLRQWSEPWPAPSFST